MKVPKIQQLKPGRWLPQVCAWVLLSAAVLTLCTAPAAAQSTPEPAEEGAALETSAEDVSAEDVSTEDVSANEINDVARTLWCPLCSGVRLDSCQLTACEQMREEIAIMLAEGQDREAIRAQFVDLYGPQVLGEPPRQGWNWVAWLLPFVALIAGGGFLWSRARQMVRPSDSDPDDSDSTPDTNAETTRDEYEQKLEDELQRYA